ncbi:neprilysin-3-like [Belonocnema kinseyi]|uniref:neprilysin-3-like n=1 Tax=Belonocnema kinseyi TaxID=2817044 RepID=UPI00143D526E|nr:neprilysin-3-like [Belonocnema kinseyi]
MANQLSGSCRPIEMEVGPKLIINGMDKTVNPCEDFYSFVCGSWPINYPVPEDKFKWDLDGMVERKIQTFLKKIVQKRPRSDDSMPLALEKKWFAACMDEGELKNCVASIWCSKIESKVK